MNRRLASVSVARHNERGAGRLKLILVLAVVGVIAYMGFQYIPVAYQAYTFRKLMDKSAEKAAASTLATDQKGSWIENELRTSAKDHGVPPDARITHVFQGNQMEVTVKFTRPINLLPGFTYNYNFEHTAKSSTFLTAN